MADIISNISVCRNAGILEERNGRSESLSFRKYNLIYGFNGAGKSTLSRLFSSLEIGERHTKLPKDCAFEMSLSDGTTYGIPANPKGLERRVTVFNSDFAENNFQWVHGTARPIFLIGKDQADAHKELGNIEKHILELKGRFATAKTSEQHALKALTAFKRDRAKLTADRLNLGGRKYEAPQLTKDYEKWPAADTLSIGTEYSPLLLIQY
ncbi:AAA family ATPase [Ochrobactrum sp. AN78]|uniref:AAA family ATPase n=1 Tax=Ochrobactrum sp. AN78 TaxID=3039853 RepID=UPI002989E8A1|nr:AAA family ATPase [Ochrobactrum sp. AN78]MDH7793889.1 wobble nucleotide-excising tRNase [Ochrobactrum sp. AN78]